MMKMMLLDMDTPHCECPKMTEKGTFQEWSDFLMTPNLSSLRNKIDLAPNPRHPAKSEAELQRRVATVPDEEVTTLVHVGVYRLMKHRTRWKEILEEAEEAESPRLTHYARAIAEDPIFGDDLEDIYGIMTLDETRIASVPEQRDMFIRLCWAAKETRMWIKKVERGLRGDFDTNDLKLKADQAGSDTALAKQETQEKPELDQWGFPKIPFELLSDVEGRGTLADGFRGIKVERMYAYDDWLPGGNDEKTFTWIMEDVGDLS